MFFELMNITLYGSHKFPENSKLYSNLYFLDIQNKK